MKKKEIASLYVCELFVTYIPCASAFPHVNAVQTALMLLAGVVTIIPLLFFSSAAQRIPLSLLGVIQYVCPSLQFLVGVLLYHEPFSTYKLIGFILVWLALLLFTAEGIWSHHRSSKAAIQEPSASHVEMPTRHCRCEVARVQTSV
ncbi:hypothetical protein SPRG_06504 [Saprolegnia parasitica CBS 223.65]|uniref:EamA domain-containing protein n=1 Tax=Saprolegnia parasitica (strain CBS 223.65) TaxID=695850 RepID=A0A067CHJ2_SAPPC|nr:hypothetical protein SPRG_06504 [Saprolegnia parasitica CBS 223.65]KDO28650.1 hypothetical protein SPRG_06504 [Saprolegnia parasitica CBS 223.65]|eukprot:XP_012200711.1 hypothetical protein SPRG_06504 [Saprolegnia parasitica CBS 223.65]